MARRPEDLVRQASEGDRQALEVLAADIQDDVYGLAMRMLAFPPDAEDATQEILIKVITHLGDFRGESSFRTWVWSIATRHLLRFRRGRREAIVSFEMIEAMIREGAGAEPDSLTEAEAAVLSEEVKIGCTGAMLVALDRDDRIAYILSEIFELSGEEAAAVLGIQPAAFRKRLSRARKRLTDFMTATCGLVDAEQPCRCRRQVAVNIQHGTIDPDRLLFATHATRHSPGRAASEVLQEADEIERAAAVFRSHPDYAAPNTLLESIRGLLASGHYRMFGHVNPSRRK